MKSRSRTVVRGIAVTAALALGLSASVGCAYHRFNPTPGVNSLGISRERNRNRVATTINTNLRAVRSDAARFWLLDRPSRLTKQPMPY